MWSLIRHMNCFKKKISFFNKYRMSGKNVICGDKKVEKSDFYKKVDKIDDINVNKMLTS